MYGFRESMVQGLGPVPSARQGTDSASQPRSVGSDTDSASQPRSVGSDTDSASQPRSVGSDSPTIGKVRLEINYVYVPVTTTHDW